MTVLFGERSYRSFYLFSRILFLCVVIIFLLCWLFVWSHALNYPDTEIFTFPSVHFLSKRLWSVESKVEDTFLSTQRKGGSGRRNSSSFGKKVGENNRARTPFTALFSSPFHLSHAFSFSSYFKRRLRGVDSGGPGDVNNDGTGKERIREMCKGKTEECRGRKARNGRIWSAVRPLGSVLYQNIKAFPHRQSVTTNNTRMLHSNMAHFNAVAASAFSFYSPPILGEKDEENRSVERLHPTVQEEESSFSFPSTTASVHLPEHTFHSQEGPTATNSMSTITTAPLSFFSSAAHAVISHVCFVARTVMPSLRSSHSDAERYDLTLKGNGVTVVEIAAKKGQRVETVALMKENRYNASVPLNNCLYYSISVDLRSTRPFPSALPTTTSTTTTSSNLSVFSAEEEEWEKWSRGVFHGNDTAWGVRNGSRTSTRERSTFSLKDSWQTFTVLRDATKDREEAMSTVHPHSPRRSRSEHSLDVPPRGLPPPSSFLNAVKREGEHLAPTASPLSSIYTEVQGTATAGSSIALLFDNSFLCEVTPSVALRSPVGNADAPLYFIIYSKQYSYDSDDEDGEDDEGFPFVRSAFNDSEDDAVGVENAADHIDIALEMEKSHNGTGKRLAASSSSSVRGQQQAALWGNASIPCEMTVFVGRETEPLASVLRYVFALALPFLVVILPLPFQLRYPIQVRDVLAEEEFSVFFWAPCLLLRSFLFDRARRVWRWSWRYGRELQRRATAASRVEVVSLPLSPSYAVVSPSTTNGGSGSAPGGGRSSRTSPTGSPLSPRAHTEFALGHTNGNNPVLAGAVSREVTRPPPPSSSKEKEEWWTGVTVEGDSTHSGGDVSLLLSPHHHAPTTLYDDVNDRGCRAHVDRRHRSLSSSPVTGGIHSYVPPSESRPPPLLPSYPFSSTAILPTSRPKSVFPSLSGTTTTDSVGTENALSVAVNGPHEDNENGGKEEVMRRGGEVKEEDEKEEEKKEEEKKKRRAIGSGEETGSMTGPVGSEKVALLPSLEGASHSSSPPHPHHHCRPPPRNRSSSGGEDRDGGREAASDSFSASPVLQAPFASSFSPPPPVTLLPPPLCALLSSSAVSNISLKVGVDDPSHPQKKKEERKIAGEEGKEAAVIVMEDEKLCRICQDGDQYEDLIAPCECTGTVRWIHRSCLDQWRLESVNRNPHYVTHCELCHKPFSVMIKRSTLLGKQISSFMRNLFLLISCLAVYLLFTVSVRTTLRKYTCAAFYHKEADVPIFSLDYFFIYLWIYICCMYGVFFAKTVVYSYFLNRPDTRQYMEEMPMTAPPVASLFWTRRTVVWIGFGVVILVLQSFSLGYIFKYFLFVSSQIPWTWEGAPFMGSFFLVLLLALLLRLQTAVSHDRSGEEGEVDTSSLPPAPPAHSSSVGSLASRNGPLAPPPAPPSGTMVHFFTPSVSRSSTEGETAVTAATVPTFPSDSETPLPHTAHLPWWRRIQRVWTDRDPREYDRSRGSNVIVTESVGNNGDVEEMVETSAAVYSFPPLSCYPSPPAATRSTASHVVPNSTLHDPNDVEYQAHFQIPPDQRIIRAYEYCPPTRVKAPTR